MARRTGIPTIYKIALRLCDLLSTFGPTLAVLYADTPALLAAIAAAQEACAVLATEANKVRDVEQV